jgi:hypothetical protein
MSSGADVVDSKEKLIKWLNAVQNSFMVGMAAVFLYEREEVWPLLEDAELGFVPKGMPLAESNFSFRLLIYFVGDRMRQEEIRRSLLLDFREYLLRNTLAETLELTREYCKATGQMNKLYTASWYHFARIIRNALTHDSIIRFDKYSQPPLIFDRWTLERSDEGRHLSETQVASTATVPLLVAIHQFVEKELA